MEFEIKNLGLTLAVGGLFVGSIYLMLLRLDFKPFKLPPQTEGEVPKFLVAAVGLAMVFGAGMLVEGVSQRITAGYDSNNGVPVLGWFFSKLVESDKALRFHILFGNSKEIVPRKDQKTGSEVPEEVWDLYFSPIGQDLMQAATNDALVWHYASQLTNTLNMTALTAMTNNCFRVIGTSNYETCIEQANQVYYKAKNIVYQEGNYFTELESFEMRKNFMLAVLFELMVLPFAFTTLLFARWVCGGNSGKEENRKQKHRSSTQLICSFSFFMVVYVAIFWGAKLAYCAASDSYNSRVFGYYATIGTHKKAA